MTSASFGETTNGSLQFTGERVIPKLMKPTNTMLLEHTARYYFSTPYCKGRVLDIACGVGYGTHMIAKLCKGHIDGVIGVDNDPVTVAYAVRNYYHPISEFRVADAMDPQLPEALGQFDTILTFETIEHLPDDRAFVRQLYQMLKPGGMLVVSTPFGEGRGIPCGQPYHVHQLTKEEFRGIFDGFHEVQMYFQRGVTIEPPREGVYYPIGVAVCIK